MSRDDLRIDSAATVKALAALENEVGIVASQIIGQVAALAADTARRTNRFKDGPEHHLRDSIKRIQDGPYAYKVSAGGPNARHALFVEAGTKAHVIEARKKRFLRFVVDGQIVFRRKVQHPGTKPTDFMADAALAASSAAGMFVEASFSRLFA